MMAEKETLAEYVTRVMLEDEISSYDIERNSHGGISQSFSNRIRNGTVLNPSGSKLNALAKGLRRPASELFAVVQGIKANGETLTHERLVSIEKMLSNLGRADRSKAEFLLGVFEREIRSMADGD